MPADRVLLLRHARTAHNHEGRYQGHRDVLLDGVGEAEAERAARVLAARLGDGAVRLVSSDLARATATARPLARLLGVGVGLDPRLREVDVGTWEGLTRAEIARTWPDGLEAYLRGDDVPAGGAERRSEASARAAAAIAEHAAAARSGALVVVSHGSCLRGAILRLIGVGTGTDVAVAGMGNARWAELRPREPRWVLLSYNAGVELEPPDGRRVDSLSRDAGA
jgi:probable phosphoglycerate mutase